MNNFKRGIITVFILMMCLGGISAQDTIPDFIKISKAFDQFKSYSVDMSYILYQDSVSNKVINCVEGKIIKMDSLIYCKMDSIEFIKGKDFMLTVNYPKSLIVLNPSQASNTIPQASPLDLQLFLTSCSKVKFKKENSTLNSYTIYPENGAYSKIYYRFNKSNYIIDKVILYTKTLPSNMDNEDGEKDKILATRLEITTKNLNTKPTINDALFSYQNYIELKGGKHICKPNFNNFKLINNLTSITK